MIIYEPSCALVGANPDDVAKLAKRLDRIARDAVRMGVIIFGGAGNGSLRFNHTKGPVILAAIDPGRAFDGGDGGSGNEDPSGVMWGER